MQNVRRFARQSSVRDAELDIDTVAQTEPASTPVTAKAHSRINRIDYSLPSRKAADRLLSAYWQHFHILYPFLDQSGFQRYYENIWTGTVGSATDERLFMASLNAIFALATQLVGSTTYGERQAVAEVFADRARECCDVLETPSIPLVQSYLLLASYYQSTQEPHACWTLVGLALRTAMSMGLHHPETSSEMLDASARELMRRVWYGCVLLDRVLSMTYGRPSEIGPSPRTATMVPLPQAIAELCFSEAETTVVGEFYTALIRLHEIQGDVLFSFYRHSDKSKAADGSIGNYFGGTTGYSLYELDTRLRDWEDGLPQALKLSERGTAVSSWVTIRRQAVILQQRYGPRRHLLLGGAYEY